MSDFIYSTSRQQPGRLQAILRDIHSQSKHALREYHGSWGSLALRRNHYPGYVEVETETHILVVVGGPLLAHEDKKNSPNNTEDCHSRSILSLATGASALDWDNILDGPFCLLLISKENGQFKVVTDLMSFIPVYEASSTAGTILGTHVDGVARASGMTKIDPICVGDFILNDVVTYPHTIYEGIHQMAPATEFNFNSKGHQKHHEYWNPGKTLAFSNIEEASQYLASGVQSYIDGVTANLNEVALFISGGEDSRSVLGMLPHVCKKHGYLFLDQMNREGRIAAKTAKSYGASLSIELRSKSHYLDCLETSSELVGSGAKSWHVHTNNLKSSNELSNYSAVFGGFYSDTLLKGHHVIKETKFSVFPFYYQRPSKSNDSWLHRDFNTLLPEVKSELLKRKRQRWKLLAGMTSECVANEFIHLWPASMAADIPNFWGNRRLFCSHEPYMCNACVKVSASVPLKWKLNRRLFQKAMKSVFKSSQFLSHGNGILPYFPWYVNSLVRSIHVTRQKVCLVLGSSQNVNDGPWTFWGHLSKNTKWDELVNDYASTNNHFISIFGKTAYELVNGSSLNVWKKINVIQIGYHLSKMNV